MPVKRAAHRPSRKHAVVEAAMHLYATRAREDISVADIAAAANMTTTALYYHYPTKEEMLLDGLTAFAETLTSETHEFLRRGGGLPQELPLHLLDWVEDHHDSATVWFAHSDGLSAAVEELRRITNEHVLAAITKAVRVQCPHFSLPHASVVAAGLLAQIDVSERAWLTDEEFCASGHEDEFRSAVSELSAKMMAAPLPT
jgi:AcrR family transcriptional regulator